MGGQTGLNVTLDLYDAGILEKYNVEVIGANVDSIRVAEDRGSFKVIADKIGLEVPKSKMAKSIEEATKIASTEYSEIKSMFVEIKTTLELLLSGKIKLDK